MLTKYDKSKNYITIKDNGNYFEINFGLKETENGFGSWYSYKFTHKPLLYEIKDIICSFYNEKCTNDILYGFTWKDMTVYLSNENQQNYKAAYDLAFQTKGKNLPITFKFEKDNCNVYYTFNKFEDLENFYLSLNKHINKCLTKCWSNKENINWEDYKI